MRINLAAVALRRARLTAVRMAVVVHAAAGGFWKAWNTILTRFRTIENSLPFSLEGISVIT